MPLQKIFPLRGEILKERHYLIFLVHAYGLLVLFSLSCVEVEDEEVVDGDLLVVVEDPEPDTNYSEEIIKSAEKVGLSFFHSK